MWDLSASGIKTVSPALQADSLPLSHQGSPLSRHALLPHLLAWERSPAHHLLFILNVKAWKWSCLCFDIFWDTSHFNHYYFKIDFKCVSKIHISVNYISFLLEFNCFTIKTIVVSAVQWSESAICIYIYPLHPKLPSHTPNPIPLGLMEHWAEVPVSGRSFPLAI